LEHHFVGDDKGIYVSWSQRNTEGVTESDTPCLVSQHYG
jgi:hypothetical protein